MFMVANHPQKLKLELIQRLKEMPEENKFLGGSNVMIIEWDKTMNCAFHH